MAINFNALRMTMEKKDITWYKLAQLGIDNRTIHRLRHNQNITTKTINKLCGILKCTPNDIMEFIPDEATIE